MKTPLIYLIAGEASGDALGAGLMRALRTLLPEVQFAGVGGEAMQREGLQSLFPYSDLSVMGFLEVVPHIPLILRRLRETALDILHKQPAVVVTIDSPGFNFRLAHALKANLQTQHIKRVHYVAPSVWAYKPERAKKTAALFDALLTLLPFEPPYFEKEGLATTFVGHPVLWENQQATGAAFRARHTLANSPLLLLLPGSRITEVKRHLPVFLEAASALPDFKIAVLAGPQVKKTIQAVTNHLKKDVAVIDISEKQDAFAAATLALSKSGTVTLELAAAGVPMVVAHRVSAFSAWLARRWILIPYVSLVNIAARKAIVPELLQEHCNAAEIAQTLHLLASPQAMQTQRGDCTAALQIFRGNNTENPHIIAARTVARLLA
jgi:lipid-A-disaccharide synthase